MTSIEPNRSFQEIFLDTISKAFREIHTKVTQLELERSNISFAPTITSNESTLASSDIIQTVDTTESTTLEKNKASRKISKSSKTKSTIEYQSQLVPIYSPVAMSFSTIWDLSKSYLLAQENNTQIKEILQTVPSLMVGSALENTATLEHILQIHTQHSEYFDRLLLTLDQIQAQSIKTNTYRHPYELKISMSGKNTTLTEYVVFEAFCFENANFILGKLNSHQNLDQLGYAAVSTNLPMTDSTKIHLYGLDRFLANNGKKGDFYLSSEHLRNAICSYVLAQKIDTKSPKSFLDWIYESCEAPKVAYDSQTYQTFLAEKTKEINPKLKACIDRLFVLNLDLNQTSENDAKTKTQIALKDLVGLYQILECSNLIHFGLFGTPNPNLRQQASTTSEYTPFEKTSEYLRAIGIPNQIQIVKKASVIPEINDTMLANLIQSQDLPDGALEFHLLYKYLKTIDEEQITKEIEKFTDLQKVKAGKLKAHKFDAKETKHLYEKLFQIIFLRTMYQGFITDDRYCNLDFDDEHGLFGFISSSQKNAKIFQNKQKQKNTYQQTFVSQDESLFENDLLTLFLTYVKNIDSRLVQDILLTLNLASTNMSKTTSSRYQGTDAKISLDPCIVASFSLLGNPCQLLNIVGKSYAMLKGNESSECLILNINRPQKTISFCQSKNQSKLVSNPITLAHFEGQSIGDTQNLQIPAKFLHLLKALESSQNAECHILGYYTLSKKNRDESEFLDSNVSMMFYPKMWLDNKSRSYGFKEISYINPTFTKYFSQEQTSNVGDDIVKVFVLAIKTEQGISIIPLEKSTQSVETSTGSNTISTDYNFLNQDNKLVDSKLLAQLSEINRMLKMILFVELDKILIKKTTGYLRTYQVANLTSIGRKLTEQENADPNITTYLKDGVVKANVENSSIFKMLSNIIDIDHNPNSAIFPYRLKVCTADKIDETLAYMEHHQLQNFWGLSRENISNMENSLSNIFLERTFEVTEGLLTEFLDGDFISEGVDWANPNKSKNRRIQDIGDYVASFLDRITNRNVTKAIRSSVYLPQLLYQEVFSIGYLPSELLALDILSTTEKDKYKTYTSHDGQVHISFDAQNKQKPMPKLELSPLTNELEDLFVDHQTYTQGLNLPPVPKNAIAPNNFISYLALHLVGLNQKCVVDGNPTATSNNIKNSLDFANQAMNPSTQKKVKHPLRLSVWVSRKGENDWVLADLCGQFGINVFGGINSFHIVDLMTPIKYEYLASTMFQRGLVEDPSNLPFWYALMLHYESYNLNVAFASIEENFLVGRDLPKEDIQISAAFPPNFFELNKNAFFFAGDIPWYEFPEGFDPINVLDLKIEDPFLARTNFYTYVLEYVRKQKSLDLPVKSRKAYLEKLEDTPPTAYEQEKMRENLILILNFSSEQREKLSNKIQEFRDLGMPQAQLERTEQYIQLKKIDELYVALCSWWMNIDSSDRTEFLQKYMMPAANDLMKKIRLPEHYNIQLDIPSRMKQKLEGLSTMKGKEISFHSYQKAAINAALSQSRMIFQMEMGLGKTVSALGLFNTLLDKKDTYGIDQMLVITPLSAQTAWVKDTADWTDNKIVNASNLSKNQPLEQILNDFERKKIDILLVNKEMISGNLLFHTSDTADLILQTMQRVGHRVLLIIDEIHMFKSAESRRGLSLEILTKYAKRIVGMTGTLKPNSVADIFYVLERVVPGCLGGDIDAFYNKYCLLGGDDVQRLSTFNPLKLLDFYRATTPYIFTRLIDDPDVRESITLPKLTPIKEKKKFDEHQAQIFKRLLVILNLNNEDDPTAETLDDFAIGDPNAFDYSNTKGLLRELSNRERYLDNLVRVAKKRNPSMSKEDIIGLPQIKAYMDSDILDFQRKNANRARVLDMQDGSDYDVANEFGLNAEAGKATDLEKVYWRIAALTDPRNPMSMHYAHDKLAISPHLLLADFDDLSIRNLWTNTAPDYISIKVLYLCDTISTHLKTNPTRNCLAFCFYKAGLTILFDALVKYSKLDPKHIEIYSGETSKKKKMNLQARFNDPNATPPLRVLLAQPNSLATGANLQYNCNFVVFVTTPWTPDLITQPQARVWRQGQTKEVFVIRPTVSSIDEKKEDYLSYKIQGSAQTQGAVGKNEDTVVTSLSESGQANLRQLKASLFSLTTLLAEGNMKSSSSDDLESTITQSEITYSLFLQDRKKQDILSEPIAIEYSIKKRGAGGKIESIENEYGLFEFLSYSQIYSTQATTIPKKLTDLFGGATEIEALRILSEQILELLGSNFSTLEKIMVDENTAYRLNAHKNFTVPCLHIPSTQKDTTPPKTLANLCSTFSKQNYFIDPFDVNLKSTNSLQALDLYFVLKTSKRMKEDIQALLKSHIFEALTISNSFRLESLDQGIIDRKKINVDLQIRMILLFMMLVHSYVHTCNLAKLKYDDLLVNKDLEVVKFEQDQEIDNMLSSIQSETLDLDLYLKGCMAKIYAKVQQVPDPNVPSQPSRKSQEATELELRDLDKRYYKNPISYNVWYNYISSTSFANGLAFSEYQNQPTIAKYLIEIQIPNSIKSLLGKIGVQNAVIDDKTTQILGRVSVNDVENKLITYSVFGSNLLDSPQKQKLFQYVCTRITALKDMIYGNVAKDHDNNLVRDNINIQSGKLYLGKDFHTFATKGFESYNAVETGTKRALSMWGGWQTVKVTEADKELSEQFKNQMSLIAEFLVCNVFRFLLLRELNTTDFLNQNEFSTDAFYSSFVPFLDTLSLDQKKTALRGLASAIVEFESTQSSLLPNQLERIGQLKIAIKQAYQDPNLR